MTGTSAAGEALPEGSLLISLVYSREEGGAAECVRGEAGEKQCVWGGLDLSASHAAGGKGQKDVR